MTAKPVPEHISDERLGKVLERVKRERDQYEPSTISWNRFNEYVLALTELQHRREAEAEGVATGVQKSITVVEGYIGGEHEANGSAASEIADDLRGLLQDLAASPSSPASGVRVKRNPDAVLKFLVSQGVAYTNGAIKVDLTFNDMARLLEAYSALGGAILMDKEQPKRTPQQIIGDDALTQLIFEGYEVMPARRSSDEQAEVVGWAYERLTHLMIAGEDRWIKHLSETEPRPSDNIRNVRRLYASPPAVAAGGVTEALRNTTQWLQAALNCKDWHWDWDQRAAASADLDAAEAVLAALAVGDEGMRSDLLAEMAKHPGWSIERGYRDRGDDEGGPYGWCVYDVRGGRSDLEWDLIGFGDTPHDALSGAVASLPTPILKGEGE